MYLSVERLIDVHSVVLALFYGPTATLPDEPCRRVGVDRAAKEHGLLMVETNAYIADGLMHREDRNVEVWKNKEQTKLITRSLILLKRSHTGFIVLFTEASAESYEHQRCWF